MLKPRRAEEANSERKLFLVGSSHAFRGGFPATFLAIFVVKSFAGTAT
jgi:hypothetical protein